VKPRWSDKLTRTVRDAKEGVTLRTRADARHYMAALPQRRARWSQWQRAAQLLPDGADAETVTRAIELALLYEARLDVRHARCQGNAE
jgi:hypothetical protein